jgi:hypothetical protein
MAGSLKYFKYTTNGGTDYAIRMDESNGEAISNTDLVSGDLPIEAIPRNITPRYVLYRSANGLHTRKIPVTANDVDLEDLPASFQIPPTTVGGSAVTVLRQSLVGEIQRPVTDIDTAQTDGDDT